MSLKCRRPGPKANESKEGASCNAILPDFLLNVGNFLLVFLQIILSKYANPLFLSLSSLHCFLKMPFGSSLDILNKSHSAFSIIVLLFIKAL